MFLGIDIGGTKLAAGVVSSEGQILSYLREPTPHTDAETLLAAVVRLAERARQESGRTPLAVGVGSGGPMRWPEGVVSPLHIPAWRDFPLRTRLIEAFNMPVVVDNDAKAFALGEALFGAGRGATHLLAMVVSTGVGGGLVINGQLQHGASGNAGHIGHTIVARRGPRCECGAVGCLTAFASGTGLVTRARTALAQGVVSELTALPAQELTAEVIARAANEGDGLARQLFREAAHALARAIASAAALLDINMVVLGGGIAHTGELVWQPLQAELQKRVRLSFLQSFSVVPATLGASSGVIGAASLAM